MKYNIATLGAAVAFALAFSSSASAADGTITINGEITDTTCNISVNGGAADATVVLPTVSASSLAAAGETAGATPFNIALSGCTGTALGTATTWFESGLNVDSTSGRLNNTGTATEVQVQLLNSGMAAIMAGGPQGGGGQNDIPVDISTGDGTLNYYAQYYATAPSTAGTVVTSVEYTLVYE